jgi:putative transposase
VVVGHELSERQACGLVGVGRSTKRYRHRRSDGSPLVAQLQEQAAEYPRYGYRHLHVLLRRGASRVNNKRA